MIITISGKPGAGKTTVAKILAKRLNYEHISMGDLRGKIALKHGLTIDELNEIGKKEIWTDKEADDELIRLGKEEDNLVIDTRIGFHFISNSIKIFLDVNSRIGAERVFKDYRPDEPRKESVDKLEETLKKRIANDQERYKKYYNIDFLDKSNYDLIIDTTNLTKGEVVDKLIKFIKDITAD